MTRNNSISPATRFGLKSFASAAMAAASPEELASLAECLPVLDLDAALAEA